MLEVAVAVVASLLVVAGVLIMMGPATMSVIRRVRGFRGAGQSVPDAQGARRREGMPPGLHPKTQRVLVGATRLGNWLRTHGHEDVAREIRGAAARLATDEPAGLYAMQTALRRVRSVAMEEGGSQERLTALSAELRKAVQDRFEQLELLPQRRP